MFEKEGTKLIVVLPKGIAEHQLRDLLDNWAKAGGFESVGLRRAPEPFKPYDNHVMLPLGCFDFVSHTRRSPLADDGTLTMRGKISVQEYALFGDKLGKVVR